MQGGLFVIVDEDVPKISHQQVLCPGVLRTENFCYFSLKGLLDQIIRIILFDQRIREFGPKYDKVLLAADLVPVHHGEVGREESMVEDFFASKEAPDRAPCTPTRQYIIVRQIFI